ncbi:MAG: platelet-activating factor acetylhydrolase, isoform II-domain-containing protein, partial [Olpidium bornovanus]
MAVTLLSKFSSIFAWPIPSVPKYSGPFAVGVHDIESTYPTVCAGLSVSSRDLASHGTVLVRLFYPAGPLTTGASRAPWLPHPPNEYASGYGALVRLPAWVSVPLFSAALLFTRGPAYMNARFLRPQEAAAAAAAFPPGRSDAARAEIQAEVAAIAASKRYPVVVFSHGLAGCRTTYSSICGELASHGMVVAAVEHRDGSAANTSYPSPAAEKPGATRVHYRLPPPVDDAKTFRTVQLEHRVDEVRLAVRLLRALDKGANVREKDDGWPHAGDFDLSHLCGALDLADNLFVAGHSFGAATALKSVSVKDNPFRAAVAFDPWMLTVEGIDVLRPVLVMN